MSAAQTAWNLLHAATLGTSGTFALPALHLSVRQVVAALNGVLGDDREALVTYQPDQHTEAIFGRYPPLHTPEAEAHGFCNDGTAAELVRKALPSAQEGGR